MQWTQTPVTVLKLLKQISRNIKEWWLPRMTKCFATKYAIFFIGPTIFVETLFHNLLKDFVSKTPQTLQIFHQVTSACENQAWWNLI